MAVVGWVVKLGREPERCGASRGGSVGRAKPQTRLALTCEVEELFCEQLLLEIEVNLRVGPVLLGKLHQSSILQPNQPFSSAPWLISFFP